LLPAWAASLFSADEGARGVLLATLRAYADADMNALKTAEQLAVHPNTIYLRLQRIHDVTGLEPRSFNGLSELLLVADCQ
jgi:sugar diacid utilization regulator